MTGQIIIHFYETLNDMLKPDQRDIDLIYVLTETRSVKDLVESIGIPHTEIDLIIVNGTSVNFNYQVKNKDNIALYPYSTQQDSNSPGNVPLIHCIPEIFDHPRFVLDVHLGKLAAYLRMLGFDSLYNNHYDDPDLADISENEERVLLTCDRKLLMRKQITLGYFVRSRRPQQQLLEVVFRYNLYNQSKPFTRCILCNGEMQPVEKSTIELQLQEKTKQHYDDFFQCSSCRKIYWKGSHYLKMKQIINDLKQASHLAKKISYTV